MVPLAHLSPCLKRHLDWFGRFCRAYDHDRPTPVVQHQHRPPISCGDSGALSGFRSRFSKFEKIVSRVRGNGPRIETTGLDYNPTAGAWHDMAIDLTRDWQLHHCHHRGHQGNNIPLPTFVHHSLNKAPLQPCAFCLPLIFLSTALCWWAKNDNSNMPQNGGRKGIRPVKEYGEDGEVGHWLVRMEWRPAGWSVFLPPLIFPCTIKSRSSLLAPAHPDGPGKRAVKRLWWWLWFSQY